MDHQTTIKELNIRWPLATQELLNDLKESIDLFTDTAAILNYGEIMGCPGCKLVTCSNHLAMKNYENLI